MPRTKGGPAPIPYGRDRLDLVQADVNNVDPYADPYLFIVEGPTDAMSAWLHDVPCLGLPGAKMTRALELSDLDGVQYVHVGREPDEAGAELPSRVAKRLAALGYTGIVYECRMPDGIKDVNALLQRYPERDDFRQALDTARINATRISAEPVAVAVEEPADGDELGLTRVERAHEAGASRRASPPGSRSRTPR
jgi:hypothetical protein